MGAPALPAQQPQSYLAAPWESMLPRAESPALRTADIDVHLQLSPQGMQGQRLQQAAPAVLQMQPAAVQGVAAAGQHWTLLPEANAYEAFARLARAFRYWRDRAKTEIDAK